MSYDPTASSRRTFVHGLLGLVPAAAVGAAVLGSVAGCKPNGNAASLSKDPVFFTPGEWRFVSAACDRLIPADEVGPGALDLGVPHFIDLQMQTAYGAGKLWYMQGPFQGGPDTLGYQLPYSPREIYRLGIAAAESWIQARHGKRYDELDAAIRDAALAELEAGKADFDHVPSAVFFAQLLQNTMEGAFADPIHGGNHQLGGWKMIGFPGARADFMDWADRGERYPLGSVSISGETS